MASRAIPVTRIGHIVGRRLQGDAIALPPEISRAVMTFQTDSEYHRPFEQSCIGRAVGGVADLAAIDPDCGVLIQERATFIDVALQARLFVLEASINQVGAAAHFPRRAAGAMWIVAVRASHKPFIHPVFERLGKLGTDVVVAAVADVYLSLCQKAATRFSPMDGMTGSTNDICLRVITAANVCARRILRMAAEAGVQNLIGRHLGEGNDCLLPPLCLDMLRSRTMTALTAHIFHRHIPGYIGLAVRVSKELEGDVRMAGPAGFTPGVARASAGLRRLRRDALGAEKSTEKT